MSGSIRAGAETGEKPAAAGERRFIPMQVGSATVYVEQIGEPVVVPSDGRIRTVSPPSPEEAFRTGGDILRECVHVIGERIESMAEHTRPQKIAVEFSLSFEVKGTASLIPVFLTGETAARSGLRVTAEWIRAGSGG